MPDYKSSVDVGTAQGDLTAQIALANPHLAGIGFDLPEVGPIFEDYVAANGLAGRVRFQPGNFFDEPIPSADVVMMGHILHDWDLRRRTMLIAQGLRRAAHRRRASSSTRPSSTTTAARTPSAC